MIIAVSSPIDFKIGAEIIKAYQKTKFSHSLIIDHDGLIYQASHGFVNACHISNFLTENYFIKCYEIDDLLIDKLFLKQQLGKKYSKLQLIKIALKVICRKFTFGDNGDKAFICSEYAGKAIIPLRKRVNDLTTPEQLDRMILEYAQEISIKDALKRFYA